MDDKEDKDGGQDEKAAGAEKPSRRFGKKKGDTDVVDSNFIPLDDLVYAPLHALAESNLQLQAHILDAVRETGSVKYDGTEETVSLKNMNIVFDQVRSGDDASVDSMQMQVPILSVIPIAGLSVDKAKISFAAEVRTDKDADADSPVKVTGRICSPEQRDSDNLPRVEYSLSVRSVPATEGLMRLTDLLNGSQVTKQVDTTPVAADGTVCTAAQKDARQEISDIRAQIARLKQLYSKVTDAQSEHGKMEQMREDAVENGGVTQAEIPSEVLDDTVYSESQAKILQRIMELQREATQLEVMEGLRAAQDE